MYLQLFRTANDAFDANSTTGVFAVMDRISHTIRLREALIKFGREFIVQHNVHNDLSEQLLNTLAKEFITPFVKVSPGRVIILTRTQSRLY